MTLGWQSEWCLTLPLEVSRKLIEKQDRLDTGVCAVVVQGDKIFYVVRMHAHVAVALIIVTIVIMQ